MITGVHIRKRGDNFNMIFPQLIDMCSKIKIYNIDELSIEQDSFLVTKNVVIESNKITRIKIIGCCFDVRYLSLSFSYHIKHTLILQICLKVNLYSV